MDWNIEEFSVGLTCSRPKKLPLKFLEQINSINKPLVLVCFGGMGFEFDYNLYNLWPNFRFLNFAKNSFEQDKDFQDLFNLITIPTSLRILDVLPYCSRIICKPGFSTFCEAITNKTGVHSVNRKGFPETLPLIKGLQDYSSHRLLTKESFMNGEWELHKTLQDPLKKKSINFDGAFTSAIKIIEFININFN